MNMIALTLTITSYGLNSIPLPKRYVGVLTAPLHTPPHVGRFGNEVIHCRGTQRRCKPIGPESLQDDGPRGHTGRRAHAPGGRDGVQPQPRHPQEPEEAGSILAHRSPREHKPCSTLILDSGLQNGETQHPCGGQPLGLRIVTERFLSKDPSASGLALPAQRLHAGLSPPQPCPPPCSAQSTMPCGMQPLGRLGPRRAATSSRGGHRLPSEGVCTAGRAGSLAPHHHPVVCSKECAQKRFFQAVSSASTCIVRVEKPRGRLHNSCILSLLGCPGNPPSPGPKLRVLNVLYEQIWNRSP